MGQTSFADGEWIGIKLDAPNGKNDGSVQAVRYFDAKPLHGIFVRRDQLKLISSSPSAQRGAVYQSNSSNSIVYKISHATFSNDYHYHFPEQATGAAFLFSPASPVAAIDTSTAHFIPSNSFQLIENDDNKDADQICFNPPVQEDLEYSNHDVTMANAVNEQDAQGRSMDCSVSLHATPPCYHQQELGDCDTENGTPSTVEYSNAYSANTSTIFYSPLLLTNASGKYTLREEEGAGRGLGISQALNDLAVENHAMRDRVLSHHKMLELTLFKINELYCDMQSMKSGQQGRGDTPCDKFVATDALRLKKQLNALDSGVQALTRANKLKRETSGCCFFGSNKS